MKIKIILILIILLAAILRLWKINEYPAGFNADEAAYAYNAYSLIQTGKDEFGNLWPVHFTSFADYKPGGTTYIMLPFVALFGLDQTVVRFPAILAGIFSVYLIFLLSKILFNSEKLGLISALFLAISPWHIHFSRGAWETNLATTFLLAGTYFFFKALEKPKYFFLWIFFYSASIYTYHTPRVVAPLIALFLLISHRANIFKNLKIFSASILFGLIIMLPFLISFTGPAVSARFSGVSVFSDIGPIWQVNRARGEHQKPDSIIAEAFHNRPEVLLYRIAQNWLSHYDGNFLFISGDKIKRSNSPDVGEMYYLDFLFIISGIIFIIKNRQKNSLLVFIWLILAPVAASLTFQSPNALRAHNMIIPLVLISSYGAYHLFWWLRIKTPKILLYTLYILLFTFMTWNLCYYLHQYFVHYPKTYPEAWEYGYKELVDYLIPIKANYNKIYISEKYDQPYIIFLFYLKYPPEKFQSEAKLTERDKFGFSTVRDFDNYHFENINFEEISGTQLLICGTDEEIPDNAKIIKTINFKNNLPAFQCAQK